MNYNEKLSDKLKKAAKVFSDTQAKNSRGETRSIMSQPLMTDDVLTFALPDGANDFAAIIKHHDATISNGNTIAAYDTISDITGREISFRHIVGTANNGIPFEASDYAGRVNEFLLAVASSPVRLRVASSNVLPSLKPGNKGMRIVRWEVL